MKKVQKGVSMAQIAPVVFLLDVDNTLLDNDHPRPADRRCARALLGSISPEVVEGAAGLADRPAWGGEMQTILSDRLVVMRPTRTLLEHSTISHASADTAFLRRHGFFRRSAWFLLLIRRQPIDIQDLGCATGCLCKQESEGELRWRKRLPT